MQMFAFDDAGDNLLGFSGHSRAVCEAKAGRKSVCLVLSQLILELDQVLNSPGGIVDHRDTKLAVDSAARSKRR